MVYLIGLAMENKQFENLSQIFETLTGLRAAQNDEEKAVIEEIKDQRFETIKTKARIQRAEKAPKRARNLK